MIALIKAIVNGITNSEAVICGKKKSTGFITELCITFSGVARTAKKGSTIPMESISNNEDAIDSNNTIQN
jgi:hypothetical protein